MNKGLLIVAVLCLLSAIIQLLAVISVPITGKLINYNLSFARYNNLTFGVFGICDYTRDTCTPPGIGYPLDHNISINNESGGVELPSDARSSISKLLVVHVVAFALSAILVVVSGMYIGILWTREIKLSKLIAKRELELRNHLEPVAGTDDGENGSTSGSDTPKSNPDEDHLVVVKKPDITPFLNFQLIFALVSCLLTLLGLLSDILLFTPHLGFLGWLQIVPIVFLAFIVTLVCFMRRSIFSRRHLDEEYFYANDDMRGRHHLDVMSSADTASDDGFYVYTNGFYSNYGDREEYNQSQQSNPNSWIRHTPYNDEDASVNSSHLERERIQLQDLPRDD